MKSFPDFIKSELNKIDQNQQNTKDIEGYYYTGKDGSQVAFWECYSNRESKKHKHDFDEYIVCVSGEYIAYFNEKKYVLHAGDEILIPKKTEQRGESLKGTRTIHFFGGKRIK